MSAGKALPRGPEASPRKRSQASRNGDYILIPGLHQDKQDNYHEVGTDEFASTVLERLPADALYRWDFVVGGIVGDPGQRRFRQDSDHDLRLVTDRHLKLAKWVKTKRGEVVRVFVPCHRDLAALVVAAAGTTRSVRELRLLPRYPVYDQSFRLALPGWNDDGIYYDQPPALVGLVPLIENPLAVLEDLVIDFPFKDAASRDNVFGLMLTPLLRPAFKGVIPFHLVGSSLERTGKGKLINSALGNAVLGCSVPTLQLGSTEEEREKRITAAIINGTTALHLDNLPTEEVLDSAALASLATSVVWQGRLLGKSKIPCLPNNLVVVMSGNNVRASGELVKRTVPIMLQPTDDHPEDRTEFVHPHIEEYASARRSMVLSALLGMVENWKMAGCPRSKVVMGGFEEWVSVVGGILETAGVKNWMGNYRAWVRGADEWSADAEILLDLWQQMHADEEITASHVLDMVRIARVFPAITAGPPSGHVVALAKRVLGPLVDRPVGKHMVKRTTSGSSSRYRLTVTR
jgi:hypothetical protein